MIYATAKSTNNTLTKCAKMQKEEQNRKDVTNGNGDSSGDREEPPRNAYSHGGRLKFFKDGKFILELERAREGERVSWVSVPRKTFWPPQGTATSTPSYRQESSTSLSVSDDNSSIQSSPWQRDHSWKQTNPRRNLSREMSFYYTRPKELRLAKSKKRRRPYDCSQEAVKKARYCPAPIKRPSLLTLIQSLVDKHATGSPPRAEVVVSPRKRFLREMEKDSRNHTEDACQKRSRSKPVIKVESPVRINGTTEETTTKPAPRNSSYSIISLLADDRVKKEKKSPANSPSHHYSPGPVAAPYQYCSTPTPEDRWYTESVDRLRSIELSHPDKRLYSPYGTPPYVPPSPYMYPFHMAPQFYPNFPRSYPGVPVYPLQLPLRPEAPSCSWAAEPSNNTEHRDENITDMPLNLSKHGG